MALKSLSRSIDSFQPLFEMNLQASTAQTLQCLRGIRLVGSSEGIFDPSQVAQVATFRSN
jgi:hypothetical protein